MTKRFAATSKAKPGVKAKHIGRGTPRMSVTPKSRRQALAPMPQGFVAHAKPGGLLVPVQSASVVSPKQAKKGFAEARDRIEEALSEFSGTFVDGLEIAELEIQVSFSADGKFLGFGVGGAFSLTLRLQPVADR